MLLLPSLLLIILPIAFFFGVLFTLNRLSGDSELVVMASAGYSLRQLAVPLLLAAGIVMGLTYACALYLMPASQRALNAKKLDIRADIGAALLNEGEFNDNAKGLTIFIRPPRRRWADFAASWCADSRDANGAPSPISPTTRHPGADPGAAAIYLIMLDGTVEEKRARPARNCRC